MLPPAARHRSHSQPPLRYLHRVANIFCKPIARATRSAPFFGRAARDQLRASGVQPLSIASLCSCSQLKPHPATFLILFICSKLHHDSMQSRSAAQCAADRAIGRGISERSCLAFVPYDPNSETNRKCTDCFFVLATRGHLPFNATSSREAAEGEETVLNENPLVRTERPVPLSQAGSNLGRMLAG